MRRQPNPGQEFRAADGREPAKGSEIGHLSPRHHVARVILVSGDREAEVRSLANSAEDQSGVKRHLKKHFRMPGEYWQREVANDSDTKATSLAKPGEKSASGFCGLDAGAAVSSSLVTPRQMFL
jgi:hypothetical protein